MEPSSSRSALRIGLFASQRVLGRGGVGGGLGKDLVIPFVGTGEEHRHPTKCTAAKSARDRLRTRVDETDAISDFPKSR